MAELQGPGFHVPHGNTQTDCHPSRTWFPLSRSDLAVSQGTGLAEVTVMPPRAGCPRALCSCWHRDEGNTPERRL